MAWIFSILKMRGKSYNGVLDTTGRTQCLVLKCLLVHGIVRQLHGK